MTDTHSELAPSAAKRWMSCPGCIRLSKGIEEVPSVYAEEGTAAHLVAQHCLVAGCNTSELADGVKSFPQHTEYVTQEMFDHVQVYLDLLRAEAGEGKIIKIETRYDLSWVVPEMEGTCDASIGEYMGLLRVYDLKYGQGVSVEPEYNPQQMLYALGAIGVDNPNEYEEVELVIVQPRAYHPDGPVRRWRTSVTDLLAWAVEIKRFAEQTKLPDAPLFAGDHCQFCRAMAVCPEIVEEAARSAMVEFNPADPAPVIDLTAPESLNMEQIAKVMSFTKILSTWAKEVEAYAKHRMESGVLLPGYKLVRGKANRKWKDVAQTEAFLKAYGDDAYTEPKLKSPAQVEKLIGMDKKALAPFWEKPKAGSVIAPEGDKRKVIQPSAQDDFLDNEEVTVIADGDDFMKDEEEDFLM